MFISWHLHLPVHPTALFGAQIYTYTESGEKIQLKRWDPRTTMRKVSNTLAMAPKAPTFFILTKSWCVRFLIRVLDEFCRGSKMLT